MIGEICIGFTIGCIFMAWLMRSTLRANMSRWEEQIKQSGIKEYIQKTSDKKQ